MLTTRGATLYNGFRQVASQACDYFRSWTYDTPLVFSLDTNNRLRRVQQLYLQSIRYYVEHYDTYRHLIPVPDRVYEILSLCKQTPYRPGSYRTDFVVNEANQIKLIETTCRFALNGFFTTGFFQLIANRYLESRPQITGIDDYTPFYDALMEYFAPFDHVCLLKGDDGRNETKYLIPVFEQAGFPVHVIPTDAVAGSVHLFENAAVIGELDHDEICRQPNETIQAVIAAGALNDYRTIFLIHDKRFYALLSDDGFLESAIGKAGAEELRPYLLPTYTRHMRPDIWEQARAEKDQWILKPSVLGKSIDVYAGRVTDADEWKRQLDSEQADTMVLQSYVTQRKFSGTIGEQQYNDYVAGTLLFFGDHYFGPGLYRASSYPVTNKVDDRKLAPLVTADTEYFDRGLVL